MDLSVNELQPLAPDIVLFQQRIGDTDAYRRWLEAFGEKGGPTTLDRIHAALALQGIASGDHDIARQELLRIQSEDHRDQVLEALVPALIEDKPIEAGEWLDRIYSKTRQIQIARELVDERSFTREPANVYRLLILLEEDPEALTSLSQMILRDHAGAPLALAFQAAFERGSEQLADLSELARLLPDAMSSSNSLEDSVRQLLETDEFQSVVASEDLSRYLESVASNPERLMTHLRRELIEDLAEEEIISGRARVRLLGKDNPDK